MKKFSKEFKQMIKAEHKNIEYAINDSVKKISTIILNDRNSKVRANKQAAIFNEYSNNFNFNI